MRTFQVCVCVCVCVCGGGGGGGGGGAAVRRGLLRECACKGAIPSCSPALSC
uniref:Secreted protein n=1 Tax=Setaria viridis TaxID=4556 RepID=A0A4U6VDG1_SETVI|nr:hypothetical protein SEVIR_3G209533v2 [Setaria viridis]